MGALGKTVAGLGLAMALATPTSAAPPVGSVDLIDNEQCRIAGWAKDPDTTDPVQVHIFADGEWYEPHQAVGFPTADIVRNDLPFPDKAHGFNFTVPQNHPIRDGQPHSLFIYAQNDQPGESSTKIGGLETNIITCTAETTPPPPPPGPPPPEPPPPEPPPPGPAGRFDKKVQVIFPHTSQEWTSQRANVYHYDNFRVCFDPASGKVFDHQGTNGCSNQNKTGSIEGLRRFILQKPSKEHVTSLNIYFPDGTFSDTTIEGHVVEYSSKIISDLTHEHPLHAYDLHSERTQQILRQATRAVARYFDVSGVVGMQIGYNVYQENLIGGFGYTPEGLGRFRDWWFSQGRDESALSAGVISQIDSRINGLDYNNRASWPLPVITPDGNYNNNEEAKRWTRAYFMKFRQQDFAVLQQDFHDIVKDVLGPSAWVFRYTWQGYSKSDLPVDVEGNRIVELAELPMIGGMNDANTRLYSFGKDEGMDYHGYVRNRCTTECAVPVGEQLGVCQSQKATQCACEPIEQSCVDDWSMDRTLSYIARGLAWGGKHRFNHIYIPGDYEIVGDHVFYEGDAKVDRLAYLDSVVFGNYSMPDNPNLLNRVHSIEPQVRLFVPGWMQGAIPQIVTSPVPFATGRVDMEFAHNLLESRGIPFTFVNEDWTDVPGPILVPWHNLIQPLLYEIPGYDPNKVIPLNTLRSGEPTHQLADQTISNIVNRVPDLIMTIQRNNPLVGSPPWVMHVGGHGNLIYNLSDQPKCIGTYGERSIRLEPFGVAVYDETINHGCM